MLNAQAEHERRTRTPDQAGPCEPIILAIATALCAVQAQSPDVQKVLASIKAQDKGQLAVSEEDGRFLRVLIASSKAKRALEIGGASGYSAIWIGLGLRETGGTLVTMEYDPVRAKDCR
jgi:predicted O-methyltransferase YrrM